jgi:hypothetical protein
VQHFRERQAMRDDVVELDLALLEPSDQVVDGALRRAKSIVQRGSVLKVPQKEEVMVSC